VGCDPSRDFFLERKIIQAQKGIVRDVLILERERITNMVFPHFKRKQLRSINFDLI